LRLQQTASGKSSFALSIHARVKLVRVSDGTTVYDQPVRFTSGGADYFEWTVNAGLPLRRVSETGYAMIATEVMERLFSRPRSRNSGR
jgi:hypothetical protein